MSEVILTKSCENCGTLRFAKVDLEQIEKYNAGAHVQEAFPNLSKEEREFFFLPGLCKNCWDELFEED